MTTTDIKNKVKRCIDEESNTNSSITGVTEATLMDNIIDSHIGDALGWCITYASGLLGNATYKIDSTTYELVKDYDVTVDGTGSSATTKVKKHGDSTEISDTGIILAQITNDTISSSDYYAELTLPVSTARVLRVRHQDWHKGITNFIAEDCDEYLELRNSIASATNEKPVAAIINSNPIRLELYPAQLVVTTSGTPGYKKVNVTFVDDPYLTLDGSISDITEITLPARLMTAFIYYLSFLVLSAYNDITKANQMLAIAKMSIGAASPTEE